MLFFFLNQINMEILLEIASFDASEKQYDILPPVSPAEAAQLWPTFSAEHDHMELHSLVKCTFQGIDSCYQSTQQFIIILLQICLMILIPL